MSLTLRDAQHVCWKNFRKINKLDPVRGKGWTPFVMVTDLLEEAGEVAAVVKGLEGFKPPEKPKTKEMLATELSDLLYIIFVLAEHPHKPRRSLFANCERLHTKIHMTLSFTF
jgi:NTP pyrophosphatase (non-canonical NTP hydrolase)